MEKYPVENGAFWMTGPIHSCHSKESSIKKHARSDKEDSPGNFVWNRGESTPPVSSRELTGVDLGQDDKTTAVVKKADYVLDE